MLHRDILLKSFSKFTDEQLVQFVHEYPYMDAARVALALRTASEKNNHNAALVLDNPIWLQFLQHEKNEDNTFVQLAASVAVPAAEVKEETKVVAPQSEQNATQEIQEESTDQTNEVSEISNNIIDAQQEDKAPFSEIPAPEDNDDIDDEGIIDDNVATEPIAETSNELTSLAAEIKQINTKDSSVDNDTKAEDTAAIPLEPYHTVDYFASQGIKVNSILQGSDKLSVQLKSFTAWLKTMRKIQVKEPENEVDREDAQHGQIVAMADNSLVKNEILTENMVDVLLSQGRTNDAIATLEKLSLFNSEKSAYFAERIRKLKEN